MLDIDQIRALPKISLHDHLDGGVRPGTIIDLNRAAGLPVPTTDAAELAALILERSRSGSLDEYLSSFELVIAALQTGDALERVATEFVEDLAADGVIYAEVRWAPSAHTRGDLSPEQAVDAVQRGIDRGVRAVHATGRGIRVEQLLTALRHEHHALDTARLVLQRRGRGVVGFDIAGPEMAHDLGPHADALALLARRCVPCTIHAGEAAGVASIRDALVDGHALRLGHGVRIVDDIRVRAGANGDTDAELGEIATWVRDRQIVLELSPTSNLHTAAAPGAGIQDHPFDLLYRLGFAVTVNVDNRTMSATTLTDELAGLAGAFDYGIHDLLRFQRTAADAAFLPRADRQALARTLDAHGGSAPGEKDLRS